MKRQAVSILLAALLLGLLGCTPSSTQSPQGDVETFIFTDSAGREVELPKNITRIAPSGTFAQMYLFALAPEYFVGISNEWTNAEVEFLEEQYLELPVLGHLYGTSDLNLESLAEAAPQVIIDVGEAKDTVVEDMNDLASQVGIPTVHISATLETTGEAYRKLGELLGLEEQAEEIALYCETAYDRALDLMESIGQDGKVTFAYCVGDTGLNVISRDSYHSAVIDLMSENVAVLPNPSSRGMGDEVDIEQMLLWDPEVIIFAPHSAYSDVGSDPVWQQLTAIKTGRYYEAPNSPYNWMGMPPSVNRYLGLMWMGALLYPEQADYDLYEEVKEYYRLFYRFEITPERYEELMENSLA